MKKYIKYIATICVIIMLFVVYICYNEFTCKNNKCNNFRMKNSKFCSEHTCNNENCFNEKIPGFDICYSCQEKTMNNEEEYTLTSTQLQQAHNVINEYCNDLIEKQHDILGVNLINDKPESITNYSCTFKCNIITENSDVNLATIYLLIDKDDNFIVQNILYDNK